jgi:alpha 1,6-mannosyltransferase
MPDEDSVMDMTGPGAFTDAVFNYLLVRWGVQPDQVSGITEATRFGDVLVYPMSSFTVSHCSPIPLDTLKPISFLLQAIGTGPYGLVWHGFHGRWHGSPGHEPLQ